MNLSTFFYVSVSGSTYERTYRPRKLTKIHAARVLHDIISTLYMRSFRRDAATDRPTDRSAGRPTDRPRKRVQGVPRQLTAYFCLFPTDDESVFREFQDSGSRFRPTTKVSSGSPRQVTAFYFFLDYFRSDGPTDRPPARPTDPESVYPGNPRRFALLFIPHCCTGTHISLENQVSHPPNRGAVLDGLTACVCLFPDYYVLLS